MDSAVLENEAMKLPALERARLADRLMETLGLFDAAVMQAWADEGERRLALFQNGAITAVDGDELVKALRKRME